MPTHIFHKHFPPVTSEAITFASSPVRWSGESGCPMERGIAEGEGEGRTNEGTTRNYSGSTKCIIFHQNHHRSCVVRGNVVAQRQNEKKFHIAESAMNSRESIVASKSIIAHLLLGRIHKLKKKKKNEE